MPYALAVSSLDALFIAVFQNFVPFVLPCEKSNFKCRLKARNVSIFVSVVKEDDGQKVQGQGDGHATAVGAEWRKGSSELSVQFVGFFNQQLLLCRFSLLTCIWLLNLLDEQSFSVHLQTYTVLV